MENYKFKNQEFENFEAALLAFNQDISSLNLPFEAEHKILGPCQLIDIQAANKHLFVTLQFDLVTKKYSLGILLQLRQLVCDTAYMESLITYQNAFNELLETHEARERESATLRYQQEVENQKAAKEAEKLKRQEVAVAAKIKKLKPEAIFSEPRTYFEVLGWLARNVSTISASIRSDYEPWFVQHFGEAAHSVVAATAKTRNGDPMKYSISFKASLKTDAPPTLLTKDGVKKRSIDSVEYIWDLVENYGFKFGKSQDIAAIKACIPSEYLSEFESGLGPDPEPKKIESQKTKTTKLCA